MKRFREWWSRGWDVPDFHWVELLLFRLGLAWAAWSSLVSEKGFTGHEGQPHPQGLANFLPLSWLAGEEVYPVAKIVFGLVLLAMISGVVPRVATLLAALIHILIHTLHNSQGSTHHHAQIVSLVLLAYCLTHWWPVIWKLVARKKWAWPQARRVEQWAAWMGLQAIAATYVLAALSKILKSKGLWVFQSHNIVVEMVKTHWQNFYGRLQESTDPEDLARMQYLLDNPNAARLLLGSGLVLEFFAFLILKGRGWSLLVGLSLIGMHLGISYLMKLNFPHNEQLLWVFAVNVPFWLFFSWRRRTRAL